MTPLLQHELQPDQPMMQDFSAVRRWPRHNVSLSIRVHLRTSSGAEVMLGHGRDVSQGGMAVYVPVEFETGDTATLELLLPGSAEPMLLRAEIKNRVGFKYGVEFINPTATQQEEILRNLRLLQKISIPAV